jgi:dihydrofolate synthase/folylpolyglutamate synthase
MHSSAQQYLQSFIDHEVHLGQVKPHTFTLDRVRHLLGELGDPQKGLTIVHVAGSKGKGSICALTANILKCAGYKTGFYSSPHMYSYRERIRILDREAKTGRSQEGDLFPDCISDGELNAMIEEIKPAVEKVRTQGQGEDVSFFELYTALAFAWFCKNKVDVAVMETGLGGRLDATNAAGSLVAAIAPISLEHTHILGDTVAQIAGEKAGIIKSSGQKVVLAPQVPEAMKVFEARCREFGIEPLKTGLRSRHGLIAQDRDRQIFDLTTGKNVYKRLELPLVGKHQRENAATSIGIAEALTTCGFQIAEEAIREGCRSVFWPGRFETVARDPVIILDGAHSPASAQVLAETVREVLKTKVIVVAGFSEDKNIASICRELEGIAREMILTKADHPRAADLPGAVTVVEALDRARQNAKAQDVILVTGSIFVISEARKLLTGTRCICT